MKASENPWRRVLYWLPAIMWMTFIFYLSSYPFPEFFRPFDFRILFLKALHMVEYGILGVFYYWAIRRTTKMRPSNAMLLSTLLAIGYGATDEIHQSFTPGRTAMAIDVVTDGVGALIGAFLFRFL